MYYLFIISKLSASLALSHLGSFMFAVNDLSILTITSKMMRNLVEGYRGTSHFSRHLLPQPLPHKSVPIDKQADYIRNFEKLGN